MKLLTIIIFIIISAALQAQVKIENVDFKVEDNNIVINYDISGEGIYAVELYYTTNNGITWHGSLKNISGYDWGVLAGKNKFLIYDVLQEHDYFISQSLMFKVKLLPNTGAFTDLRDSTKYKWTRIGSQVWMAENLKAIMYPDGTPISIIKKNNSWEYLEKDSKACCWYKNKNKNFTKYGVLYTWGAATNNQNSKSNPRGVQGICPDGWHIPSDTEWEQLANYIRKYADTYVSKHLKSKNGWENSYGTDYYNFSGLPGGYRGSYNGKFYSKGISAYWWSSTHTHLAYCRKIYDEDRERYKHSYYYNNFKSNSSGSEKGYSVRCVKN